MYPRLTFMVFVVAAVADFVFLTNFWASVLMSLGLLVVVWAVYSVSSFSIGGTHKCYWRRLMFRWKWYSTWCTYCGIALFVSLLFILPIYYLYYVPRGYVANIAGIGWTLVVMMGEIFLAYVFGTRRGFEVYAW